MLFGLAKVGPRLHFFATLMVAIGTLISATWIIAVNSWMQTPQGFTIAANGQFIPVDWWAIVFNPSFPYRLVHTVLASYLTTAFFIGAIGALHLLRDNKQPAARIMFSMAMWMATLVAPLQILAGDMHGINTLEYQPAKIAAMEGHYETEAGASLILFGVPDDQAEVTRYQIAIPKLGSLILTHKIDGVIKGLKDFPADARPPAQIVFWSFRVMVGLGFAMLGLGLWSFVRRFQRDGLYRDKWLHRASLIMAPTGFIAVIAGWITTEVGRQPFTIYNQLRTAQSVAPIDAAAVATSLLVFIVVYFFVFGAGIFYILRLCNSPPKHIDDISHAPSRSTGITPAIALATREQY
jgi:cytochrome d ubiquinol oxidase subunit I